MRPFSAYRIEVADVGHDSSAAPAFAWRRDKRQDRPSSPICTRRCRSYPTVDSPPRSHSSARSRHPLPEPAGLRHLVVDVAGYPHSRNLPGGPLITHRHVAVNRPTAGRPDAGPGPPPLLRLPGWTQHWSRWRELIPRPLPGPPGPSGGAAPLGWSDAPGQGLLIAATTASTEPPPTSLLLVRTSHGTGTAA